jgi:hypothetical protein
MRPDPVSRAKLCLKARPTATQLADRLRPVDGTPADGLELYLDVADIADDTAMDAVVARVEASALPADFALLAEGPVGSLDGAFFDITRASPADRLVVDRLALLARRLGLQAVNIHAIAPSADPASLTLERREAALSAAVPFLDHFVEVTRAAGAVPTIENMPPVMRMRVEGWYFSPIGMASADLCRLVGQVPGLAVLPDSSHAGLYLNARRMAADRGDGPRSTVHGPRSTEDRGLTIEDWQAPLFAYLRQLPCEPSDLVGYFAALAPHVVNAQISNAAGLLGEGLPYAEGDYHLDPVIGWLGDNAQHIVTETLEPNHDDARYMRDALRRMRLVLG